MKKSLKRFIGMLAVVALCLGILNINAIDAQAATSITGNNTSSTAYNYGRWSSINSNYATIREWTNRVLVAIYIKSGRTHLFKSIVPRGICR